MTGHSHGGARAGRLATSILAITTLALAGPAAGATVITPAAGALAASSSTCDGVWVVVDASALGGSAATRCAPGNPSDGFDALTRAGFSYDFVPNRPGFVCTIDARPDPCNGAPTDAYWSYWHAPTGGSWTYSQRGAASRDPAPGTVEGWAFGAGDPPAIDPPAAPPAATPQPEPEPEPAPEASADPAPASRGETDAPRSDGGTDPNGAPRAAAGDGGQGEDGGGDDAEPATSDNAPDRNQSEVMRRRAMTAGDPRLPRSTWTTTRGDEAATAGAVGQRRDPDGDEDPVALATRRSGGTTAGPILGALLITGLAGAALLRSRRRTAADG